MEGAADSRTSRAFQAAFRDPQGATAAAVSVYVTWTPLHALMAKHIADAKLQARQLWQHVSIDQAKPHAPHRLAYIASGAGDISVRSRRREGKDPPHPGLTLLHRQRNPHGRCSRRRRSAAASIATSDASQRTA